MASGTNASLQAVWGSSSTNVYAAGYDDYGEGVILHYNGSAWSAMTLPDGVYDINGLWGASASDIYAVGKYGTILHYNGSAWSAMTSNTTKHLNAVWGSAASDVFAVGANGTIMHTNDGTTWAAQASGTTKQLNGVWGTSGTDVFAIGADGTIIHYNGVWSAQTSNTEEDLNAVWGSAANDVYAVGNAGTVLRYTGTTWGTMTSGSVEAVHAVWGSSSTNILAASSNGDILTFMKPSLLNLSTDEGNVGQTLDVTITGTNFGGATAVSFGTGITVNSFVVDSSTQITANITVDTSAVEGARDVAVVISGGNTSLEDAFTVIQALPTVTSIDVVYGHPGGTAEVVITGTNFTGTTAVSFGDGIVVDSFTEVSSTEITASITIETAAALEARDVTVTTPGGTATLDAGFEVRGVPISSWVWVGMGLGIPAVLIIAYVLIRKRIGGKAVVQQKAPSSKRPKRKKRKK
jgi:hypothetical protein